MEKSCILTFIRPVDSSMSNVTETLLPWYLGYLGGNWSQAIQCMSAGSNGYRENHASINGGLNNGWARNNTPWSWGYLNRHDLPVQFAIAEGWTVGDMYQESQITATNPNRVTLVSGSINAPGSPQTPDEGGVYIDNNETPGCESPNLNCYPLKWKTIFDIYEAAGVSWQVYQGVDNFDDNPLAWFEQFQNAPPTSALSKKGMAYLGLDAFYADAALGTLPRVSFIVGPRELSEHPPYSPSDGGWLQYKILDAVVRGPKYGKSALLISYDESGGWGDHVPPYHSPENTTGEWLEDPYNLFGNIYTGPGVRVPFYIVSPWTRGGRVFTEHADHNSQILFIEEWLTAKGYNNVRTDEMVHWRRQNMAHLLNALDFENPDLSVPDIPRPKQPHRNSRGEFDGSAFCESQFPDPRPPPPYSSQPSTLPNIVEEGYKICVGQLTEGRYLVFENEDGRLLAHNSTTSDINDHDNTQPSLLTTMPSSQEPSNSSNNAENKMNRYRPRNARWVIYYYNNNSTDIAVIATNQSGPFLVSSFDKRVWLAPGGRLVSSRAGAAPVDILFFAGNREGEKRGYSISYPSGGSGDDNTGSDPGYINVDGVGNVLVGEKREIYNVVSVTYYD
ncbi:non-hemolytic phospholipase C precursor, Hc yeast-phase induced, conidia-enriched transcript [Histoplasma capsulatum var. duboisii H88]|uniref:Non-hemolytic phospholipase C, Hc yeast-phase induced, conidia-enriched transcript n=1 Tax=Ajellomyces capsulatus (strain H88) TaxID=544711 RepID=A0A8A1LJH6_AJEC8|nr:non-hemolytic phospholipase C precursor, Hc yeast-phase induced, conidia-enriched transcript [Histoplasma capsulatum var. duboisii H88]